MHTRLSRRHVEVSKWNSAFRQLEIRSHLAALCVREEGKQRATRGGETFAGETRSLDILLGRADSSKIDDTFLSSAWFPEGLAVAPLYVKNLRKLTLHDDEVRSTVTRSRINAPCCVCSTRLESFSIRDDRVFRVCQTGPVISIESFNTPH